MERKTILQQDAPISAHNMNTHAGCDLETNDMTLFACYLEIICLHVIKRVTLDANNPHSHSNSSHKWVGGILTGFDENHNPHVVQMLSNWSAKMTKADWNFFQCLSDDSKLRLETKEKSWCKASQCHKWSSIKELYHCIATTAAYPSSSLHSFANTLPCNQALSTLWN